MKARPCPQTEASSTDAFANPRLTLLLQIPSSGERGARLLHCGLPVSGPEPSVEPRKLMSWGKADPWLSLLLTHMRQVWRVTQNAP